MARDIGKDWENLRARWITIHGTDPLTGAVINKKPEQSPSDVAASDIDIDKVEAAYLEVLPELRCGGDTSSVLFTGEQMRMMWTAGVEYGEQHPHDASKEGDEEFTRAAMEMLSELLSDDSFYQ